MHKLDDNLLVSAALTHRLRTESEQEAAWVVLQRGNGGYVYRSSQGFTPMVFQMIFAKELVSQLNRHVGEGGAWVVGWTHGGDRLMMIWLDGDGDARFVVENDEDTPQRIVATGIDRWCQDAAEAHARWREMQRALDVQPDQQYKAAMGEPAPSTRR